jgi:siroheme synthase
VGKRGNDQQSWKQDDINDLLLQKSIEVSSSSSPPSTNQQQQHQRSIVRLKGGDPFLFGRTGTEIHTLQAHNISYTYTPGISSCIAGPHLGGIPLTDTTLNCQSFGVWSGTDAFGRSRGLDNNNNDNNDDSNSDKQQLQSSLLSVDTLVFLMIGRLDKLDALCQFIATKQHHDNGNGNDENKWNTNTPCAIIQNAGGTRSDSVQKVWRSTLGKLVSDIKEDEPNCVSVSPAVLVVGATAELDLLSQEN